MVKNRHSPTSPMNTCHELSGETQQVFCHRFSFRRCHGPFQGAGRVKIHLGHEMISGVSQRGSADTRYFELAQSRIIFDKGGVNGEVMTVELFWVGRFLVKSNQLDHGCSVIGGKIGCRRRRQPVMHHVDAGGRSFLVELVGKYRNAGCEMQHAVPAPACEVCEFFLTILCLRLLSAQSPEESCGMPRRRVRLRRSSRPD